MKHLYSLVFVFIALTSSNLSSAQIVYPLPTSSPSTCDGSVHFYDHINYDQAYWTWTWYEDSTTVIATGDSVVSNLCAGLYSLVLDSAGSVLTVYVTVNDPCSNILLSASATNCTPGNCDGTIQATVTGGSGPYSFSVSGGPQTGQSLFSNLCAGTYSITVVDINGCSAVATATVTDLTGGSIIPNLTSTNALSGTCSGSASVSPTGGSGGYTYLWSSGQTTSSVNNLCPGTYTVLITDSNQDTVTASCVITNPCSNFHLFVSTAQTIPGNCIGVISVTPNFSTSSVSWSNGATGLTLFNLCSGVYTINCVANNGCLVSESITIADSLPGSPFNAALSFTDDLTGSCTGSATIQPTGGFAPYSYYWSTGDTTSSINNLCAGIYSAVVWDATNIDTLHFSFAINDSSTTYGNNPYPNGAINDTLYTDLVTNCVIDYNAIDSASLYQAVYNSSNQSLYVTWAVYSPTDTVYISDTLALIGNPGYYALTISVFCPNKSGNDFMKINGVIYFDGTAVHFSTLGVDEHLLDNVSVYPNPFSSFISIDNKDGVIQSMKLMDLNGRVISEIGHVNSGLAEMNGLEGIASGTYLLILSGENSSKAYKVIK